MSKKGVWSLIIGGVLVLLLGGLAFTTELYRTQASQTATAKALTQKRPLIMIAGSSSTRSDFDDIHKSLNGQKHHPVLTVTVTAKQQLQFSNSQVNKSNINNAIIDIYFEDSTDSNDNIITQTTGLAKAMTALQKRFDFKSANALGYSNGGLIWSRYLAGLATDKPETIHDLMLIGTPFLGTDEDHPDHDLYDPMLKNKDKFDSLHTVINIAGDTGNGDDNVVPLSSVTAGSKLFMNKVTRYTAMTVNQKSINHGDLLHEAYVARLIRQNLITQ
ncbi:alpha/beta hydrolase [Lactiplantibacillus herbarum]|uniref:alpha/beta hydrolase n=1 Tax=Lactiplantibacillus herbarum TaxID=1670446 RepID=UPI00064E9B23|nr:alpha/beta hydrolase [Lactiplantibacillus herbarum]